MANSRVEADKRKMNLKYAVISESNKVFKTKWEGPSLVVQWLRFGTSNAGGLGRPLVEEPRSHMLWGPKQNTSEHPLKNIKKNYCLFQFYSNFR